MDSDKVKWLKKVLDYNGHNISEEEITKYIKRTNMWNWSQICILEHMMDDNFLQDK